MGDKIPFFEAYYIIICPHTYTSISLEYILHSDSILICIQHYRLLNVLCVDIYLHWLHFELTL